MKIQNEGDATDEISVKGRAPATGFTLTVTEGGTDVTWAFLKGTLSVELAPGAEANLSLTISVDESTAPGTVEKELVRLTSASDVTMKGALRARVTVEG